MSNDVSPGFSPNLDFTNLTIGWIYPSPSPLQATQTTGSGSTPTYCILAYIHRTRTPSRLLYLTKNQEEKQPTKRNCGLTWNRQMILARELIKSWIEAKGVEDSKIMASHSTGATVCCWVGRTGSWCLEMWLGARRWSRSGWSIPSCFRQEGRVVSRSWRVFDGYFDELEVFWGELFEGDVWFSFFWGLRFLLLVHV